MKEFTVDMWVGQNIGLTVEANNKEEAVEKAKIEFDDNQEDYVGIDYFTIDKIMGVHEN